MKRQRIHCLGVMVVDALSGPLPHYPLRHRRSQVVTPRLQFQPGGGAVNAACALARMGLRAAVFSKIGRDPNGAFLLRELRRLGVDVSPVRVSPRDPTPFTYVGLHPGGDRTFIHTPGANLTFGPRDLPRDRLFDAEFLLYPDLWVLPELDGAPACALLAEARRRGVTTLLDECWGLGPNRRIFERMLPHCDYAIPSLDDLQAIYPRRSEAWIADRLLDAGARHAVLKMGRRGCLVAAGAARIRIPIIRVPVVDTTGAGDCWNAGFVAGLAQGEDLVTAARLGTACAAFCVSAVGGSAGVPDYARVYGRAMRA
jgi:sugar/nucleoside kinase (ribokinase family)